MTIQRNRLHYAMMAGLVVVAGCASRSSLSSAWPAFVVEYAGDTLWALMVFLGVGVLFPALSTLRVGVLVLIFAFGIEFSQLYSADWINHVRQTFWGAVVLGSGFLWSDFVCYTLGCGVGVLGEMIAQKWHTHPTRP